MRSTFLLTFATVAFAAPASLGEWGHAISRLGSWVETVADPYFIFGDGVKAYDDTRTIYDMLKASNEYTHLMKWVDMNKDIADKLKGNKRLTFFAPNNDAMPNDGDIFLGYGEGGDRDQDRRRKEYIREMLLYSMLPEELDVKDLALNSTVATELHAEDGSFGGRQRRIKIEESGTLKINNYVKVMATYHTKNGIVHAVDHPLFVPPDIMDALYLYPKMFAAASVSLLKTGLEKELEFNSDNSKNNKHRGQLPFPGHHGGSKGRSGFGATTIFVPTNDAFNKLPNDLVTYLFSPMGERVLRKLMEFHTIPDYVLYTEWIKHIETKDQTGGKRRSKHYVDLADEDFDFHVKQEFPTLCRQKLPIEIEKTKTGASSYKMKFTVHGLDVENRDNVAQNGAIHVIGTVLCPRHREATDVGKDEQDWKEWREWLVDWAKDN